MIDVRRWSIPPVRLVEPASIALATVIGLAVLAAAIGAAMERAQVRRLNETYTQLTGVQPSASSARPSPRDEMVKRISSHRLIAPPPSFQLTGVLGDAAVFNGGMLVKAGQSAGDMKILSVGASWVEVEQNGQTQKLYVFPPSMFSAPSPAMPGQGTAEPNSRARPDPRQSSPVPVLKDVSRPQ